MLDTIDILEINLIKCKNIINQRAGCILNHYGINLYTNLSKEWQSKRDVSHEKKSTQNENKYRIKFARTKRYEKSALPFMAALLKREVKEKKEMLK